MKIIDVAIYLESSEFDRSYSSEFQFSTRFIFNFLRRSCSGLKLGNSLFTRLIYEGRIGNADNAYVSNRALVIPFTFDKETYDSLDNRQRNEYIYSIVNNCEFPIDTDYSELKKTLSVAIQEFKKKNELNHWIFLKKRSNDLCALLDCTMDRDRFVLKLIVTRNEEIVIDQEILETRPDEVIFAYQFKYLTMDERKVVVKNRFHKTLYEYEIA